MIFPTPSLTIDPKILAAPVGVIWLRVCYPVTQVYKTLEESKIPVKYSSLLVKRVGTKNDFVDWREGVKYAGRR